MRGSAIVIGAGASGLAAADALMAEGVAVRLLEAGKSIGGRIRALEQFCDIPVELGAEEIHGHDNLFYELARETGAEILSHSTADDAVRFDGKLCFLGERVSCEVRRAMEWMARLRDYRGEHRSVEDQLILEHFPRRSWHYLDSRLGVEHGTSIGRLAMWGFHNYEEHWELREHNYTLKGSLIDSFRPIAERAALVTELNCPIQSITWQGKPKVHALDGRNWEADVVIVTASVAALKAGYIRFDPALPAAKSNALHRISMDGGMKVILKFRERFWPDRMYFLHTDGFLPQFWSTCQKKSTQSHILTAFIGGTRYEELQRLGVNPVEFALDELGTIFAGDAPRKHFENSYVMDWKEQPHIGGLYSYIGMDERRDDRVELSAPVGGKLFFAGEAAETTGNHGTVHGALESGRRAAREALSLFRE